MEDKENGNKRPPRLPAPSSSRNRNRGRSATRRHLQQGLTSNSSSTSVSTRTSESGSTGSNSNNRNSHGGSRIGVRSASDDNNFLGFDTIILRSQSPNRNRSTSRSAGVNANQKKVKTHSKKYMIKTPKKRVSSDSGANGQHRGGSRSRSRGKSLGSGTYRDRSHSRTRTSEDGKKRARSTSRSSHVSATKANGRRNRSVSQTRSVGSFVQYEVEPNVHHNAILTTEIQCPAIVEMKENELYAKNAGLDFTLERGDELTISDPGAVNKSIQDERFLQSAQFSPKYKKEPGSFLFDEDMPTHATFLRENENDGDNGSVDGPSKILGNNTDFRHLKLVAGQLCANWGGNEFETPTIARRIIDFQFAQHKRRKKFGNERPWGILGLYDHLAGVRADVEWAEIAACRRANGEPYKAWFEYVGEKKSGKNRPFFTLIILTICTVCMIASIGRNDNWSLEPLSVNPMLGPSSDTLVEMGAKDSRLIVQEGQAWRVLSAMVLHAGLIHFFLNMLALWFVGKAIEQCHGFFASMLLFVAPGIGGTILSAIFLPNFISVGASGGIFGLIGACLADIFLNWGLLFNDFVNSNDKNKHSNMIVLLVLVLDIIVNSLIGLTPFVDNFTHLGGMIFGFMCGTSTMQRVSTEMFESIDVKKTFWGTTKKNFSRFAGIILTLVAMTASFAILMYGNGVSTPCKSCRIISCVAFPPWAGNDDKWWYCDDCGGVTADATINPETRKFDVLSLNCPYGDVYTMSIDNQNADKAWLEQQLPSWCRAHCTDI